MCSAIALLHAPSVSHGWIETPREYQIFSGIVSTPRRVFEFDSKASVSNSNSSAFRCKLRKSKYKLSYIHDIYAERIYLFSGKSLKMKNPHYGWAENSQDKTLQYFRMPYLIRDLDRKLWLHQVCPLLLAGSHKPNCMLDTIERC